MWVEDADANVDIDMGYIECRLKPTRRCRSMYGVMKGTGVPRRTRGAHGARNADFVRIGIIGEVFGSVEERNSQVEKEEEGQISNNRNL